LVEFPEDPRAMALKGPKISLDPFLFSSLKKSKRRKRLWLQKSQ
jgi:hypothetical protein